MANRTPWLFERLQRRPVFFSDCNCAALPRRRLQSGDWGSHERHHWPAQPGGKGRHPEQRNLRLRHGLGDLTRGFTLEGCVQTSHGRVDTKVVQSIDFSNWQKYNVALDGSVYDQTVKQITSISSATATMTSGKTTNSYKQFHWPLNLSYAFTAHPDGSSQQDLFVATVLPGR